jgi:hypothetical protein
MKLTLLSRRVEQTITYHCMNSQAWNEQTKKSVELIGYDEKIINMASPMFYRPKVIENGCNVSMQLIVLVHVPLSQICYTRL